MSDLTRALEWEAEVDDYSEMPFSAIRTLAAAARRVAEAPETLYCTNHYQLGNELWCTYGHIWDKPCDMVPAKLLVDPPEQT